ncbi:hypothetical protein GCM10027456_06330 [Kineosporia babensis]
MTTAGERALSSWGHGWDGVAQGYETATENRPAMHLEAIRPTHQRLFGPVSQSCDAKDTPHNATAPRSPTSNSPIRLSGAKIR